MSKYNEIFKLKDMLDAANIEYKFSDRSIPYPTWLIENGLFEHYQIVINDKNGNRIVSVIEGEGTYGAEIDKLEIMGLLTDEELESDEVKGWLTADDVFKRISKYLKNKY